MSEALRADVVYGVVVGRVANESGHYLLVVEERLAGPLAIRPPKPFYVGVDPITYSRAKRGDRHPLGGSGA